jgi:pimeloyl-ACP methyl ester carboxylesterase
MDIHVSHTIEDGIERISFRPASPRFRTPILMQHGMWHGAWCWEAWQEELARLGWESHAFSLPGHAGSPVQRPLRWCTLDYYLRFLTREVGRLPRRPVLFGHSMGGALAQWYLKRIADDLPAAVLVAPWTANSMIGTIVNQFRLDLPGSLLALLTLSAAPVVRSPQTAARLLITQGATMSARDLHSRLGSESLLVLFQHNPPFWFPPRRASTPLLWLAAEKDAFFPVERQRRSAQHYAASFILAREAGHDVMLERHTIAAAHTIHEWLAGQEIP